ncbi:MAG: hypothetical protein CMO01_02915 [Thalassobius sp.]|nr:hypothetical protein [Thalassovita sp.]|tara:strand:- start:2 stop:454 length:453 start_codon:yes stop_codon:yes gene_type:complete
MKKFIYEIFTVIFFTSCSFNEHTQTDLTGCWISENITIGFVHANIYLEKADKQKIDDGRINLDFQLDINADSTFIFLNQDSSFYEGKYLRKQDSLILEKDNLPWLSFSINQENKEYLILTTDRINFVSQTKDTINLFMGENIELKIKNCH